MPTSHDGDGAAAGQRARVRGGVDASGHAGDDDKPGACELGREILGDAAAVDRGVAAADQRDGPCGQQGRVALDGDHRRGVIEPGEQRRIVGVPQQQQPGAELRGAFDLENRIGLGRHRRWVGPPAGFRQSREGLECRGGGGEAGQQVAVGDRANALGAGQPEAVDGVLHGPGVRVMDRHGGGCPGGKVGTFGPW